MLCSCLRLGSCAYLPEILPIALFCVKGNTSSRQYKFVYICWKNGSLDRNSLAVTSIGAAESCPHSQQYHSQAPSCCSSILCECIMQVILQFLAFHLLRLL